MKIRPLERAVNAHYNFQQKVIEPEYRKVCTRYAIEVYSSTLGANLVSEEDIKTYIDSLHGLNPPQKIAVYTDLRDLAQENVGKWERGEGGREYFFKGSYLFQTAKHFLNNFIILNGKT